MADWMIYGATGYTGQLVAEEAVRRAHTPLLAGRSEGKLRALAARLGLDYAVAPLDDADALRKAVSGVRLVYNAAGPFVHTCGPVVDACLAEGAHYLDITGELEVYQRVFARHDDALAANVALVPGVGFDVVPSDCLARYVADQLSDANELVTVIAALGASGGVGISSGTAKTELEMMRTSGFVERRMGQLVDIPPGSGARRFPFPGGDRLAMPVPWGDLETAYRSTGIPNITSYIILPPPALVGFRLAAPVLLPLLRQPAVQDAARDLIDRTISGPDEATRQTGRTLIYAEARTFSGETRRAWLETCEAYQFTMLAGVRAVEHMLASDQRGALAPSQALGADFVLGIDSTQRWDTLADGASP